MVALTGRAEAYYSDTRGEPQEFISAAKYGYLFQGQHYRWQRQPRGTPAWGLRPSAFVAFLAEPRSGGQLRARTARAPADQPGALARDDGAAAAHARRRRCCFRDRSSRRRRRFCTSRISMPELAAAVRKGRADFLCSFRASRFRRAGRRSTIPATRDTFERCKLDFSERERTPRPYALHRDLLRLRREDAAFRRSSAGRRRRRAVGVTPSCCASSRAITPTIAC